MKALHRKRLEKLATHLEKGKLGHDKFDFSRYTAEGDCGTSGCALGECPTLFRKHWRFYHIGDPIVADNDFPIESAQSFFGLDHGQAKHLFYPLCQNTRIYGGRMLGNKATRRQVASNIRAFIKKMEKTKP
jgi:hypothetical protein